MADEKERVIFEVDVTSYEKSLALLSNSINALKADQKALADQTKQGMAGAAEALERTNAQLKVQQQEYRTAQSVLVGYIGAQKKQVDTQNFANNSIQANRDLLKQLTAQYISTVKPSEQFTAKVKQLSDELKRQEGAIGNNTRTVGGYKEAFISALGAFFKAIPTLNSVVDPLKNISSGFKDAGGGAAGLSAAFSTGILAVIPLVISGFKFLADILKQFDAVADAVEAGTNAISAGFRALVTGGDVVETSKQAYELTRQLQDLEDAQLGVKIATAEYDAEISRLLVSLRNKNLTEKEGKQILSDLKNIEQERFKITSENAKEELRIAREQFANKSKLTQQEIDLLLDYGVKNDFITDKQKKQREEAIQHLVSTGAATRNEIEKQIDSEKEIAVIKAENIKKDKAIDQDELKRISDLTVAVSAIKGESALLNEKIKNREDEFDNRMLSQKEARLKKEEELAKKQQQTLPKFKEVELKNLQDVIDKNNADELAKKAAHFNELIAFNKQVTDNELERNDQSLISAKEKEEKKQKILLESLRKQLNFTIEYYKAIDGEVLSPEHEEAVRTLMLAIQRVTNAPAKGENKTFGDSLGLDKENIEKAGKALGFIEQGLQAVQKIVNADFEIRMNQIETERQAEVDAVENSHVNEETKQKKIKAINKKAAKEKYEAEKAAFETNQALQIVNAVIGGAIGVVNAFQLGPIAGAVAAAIIAATTVAEIAVIASQKPPPPPKFAGGVIGLNGPGTETSDSIDAKLSRGESVITAKATRAFHRELAQMELAVGNTPNYNFSSGRFATGVIGDGGFSTRGLIDDATQLLSLKTAIKEGFTTAPQPVVSVVEIQKVNSQRNRSIAVSEL